MTHERTSAAAGATRPAGHTGRLRKDALNAFGAATVAMAFMGPATSVYFNTSPAAAGAGHALPLAMLLSMSACLLVASSVGEFARKLPCAGFAYTFNTHGFGRAGGFMSGWILALSYAMVGPMLFAGMGAFGSSFFASQFGRQVPYWAFTTLSVALVWGVAALGIDRSARTALIFLSVEMGVLLALCVTILIRGGAGGLAASPLSPALSHGGLSGLGVGMLWGILSFIGFESAGTLGEETKDARRGIPAALFVSVGVIGLFYIFCAYAAAVGFGLAGSERLAGDAEPWVTLTGAYWGRGLLWVISLTVMSSVLAALISGCNAAVRVIFAMGRENIFPGALGSVSPSRKPLFALSAYMLFSLILALAGSAAFGPFGVWNFCGTLISLGMIIIYVMVNVALFAYYRREHPREFSALRHAALPLAANLLMLLPIYGLLWPAPPFPYNLVPYVLAAWAALGAVYLAAISRRHPEVLRAMGRVWGDETDELRGGYQRG